MLYTMAVIGYDREGYGWWQLAVMGFTGEGGS